MPDRRMDHELLRFVENDNLGGVEVMLAAGANIDGSEKLSYRPLIKAAYRGYVDMVKFLIAWGADVEVAMRPVDGRTNIEGCRALHLAVQLGRIECVRALIEAGADVNAVDGNAGFTPLVYACRLEHAERCVALVRVLLESGADPAVPTDEGCIALHYVAGEGHVEATDMILSRASETLYHIDRFGKTPVCYAAKSGCVGAMEFLLSSEAMYKYDNLDSLDDRLAKSPLVAAAGAGQSETVRVLLTGWMDEYTWTLIFFLAVEIAAFHGRARILQILLDAYEEEIREKQDFWERLPLTEEDLVDDEGLEKCPFDLDEQLSPSALCNAVEGGHLAAAGVLLAAGVNETVADIRGRVAIALIVGSARVGGRNYEEQEDRSVHEAAIKRMLLRGPAFRARSWTWPMVAIPTSTIHFSDEGDTRGPKKGKALCVHIFRREKSDRKKAFVKAFERYALSSL